MERSKKAVLWARRIAAWERSGLSRPAWCAAEGVNVHTLDYWRWRLRSPQPGARLRSTAHALARSKSGALVPIVVREPAPSVRGVGTGADAIEIALPGGMRMRAAASTDVRWLAELIRELGRC